MKELSIEKLIQLNIIPSENDELLYIYTNALSLPELNFLDFITTRDVIQVTGYDFVEIHLLLLCMFLSLYDGSVCMSLNGSSFLGKLKLLAGKKAAQYRKKIIAALDRCPDLVHKKEAEHLLFDDRPDEYKPLVMVEQNNQKKLYFQKYYFYERNLYASLYTRFSVAPDFSEFDSIRSILADILNKQPIIKNSIPVKLNARQLMSVALPLVNNLVIISGGPGTGKTSVVINLLRAFLKQGISFERIKIAAPTGRASQRMTDSILEGLEHITDRDEKEQQLDNISGATIHKLLKYSPYQNGFFYNSFNKLNADVVIVDEVSMVDVELLSSLFAALNEETHVILIGDKDQLPSVEAGAILACLVPGEDEVSYSAECVDYLEAVLPDDNYGSLFKEMRTSNSLLADSIVMLDESFRANKSLQQVAVQVNRQNQNALSKSKTVPVNREAFSRYAAVEGVHLLDAENKETGFIKQLSAVLDYWAEEHFFQSAGRDNFAELSALSEDLHIHSDNDDINNYIKRLFFCLDSSKILSPVKNGHGSTGWINEYYTRKLSHRFDSEANDSFFSGMPIIITRNDYRKELYNGDIGIILKDSSSEYFSVFNRPGGFIVHPVDMLSAYEPAYAITVHKSQGSEYGSVLLVVPEDIPGSLLTKEIIYTGITRAKQTVFLYGKKEQLQNAVKNRIARESGLLF